MSFFMENGKYNFSQDVHSCANTDNSCPNVSQYPKEQNCPNVHPSTHLWGLAASLQPTPDSAKMHKKQGGKNKSKWKKKIKKKGVPVVAQWKRTWLVTVRTEIQSLALVSGLRIWRCHEMCCRSWARLGSGVAVAVVCAGGYSSDSWELPYAAGVALRQKKKKKSECYM